MELAHMAYDYENQPKICAGCRLDIISVSQKEIEEADEIGIFMCEYCKESVDG
jgi:predicted  nucleic acid-binding Zn-ribbon protein